MVRSECLRIEQVGFPFPVGLPSAFRTGRENSPPPARAPKRASPSVAQWAENRRKHPRKTAGLNPRPGVGIGVAEAMALIGAVSVVINRSNGAFTMEEHAVENWQAQGRVGKTETRAREDENKRKRKREQMAWEAGEKRARGGDIRGEGDTFDDMG